MSNIFKLNIYDVGGAVLSAIIVAVLGYLGTLTNVMEADWQQVLNVAFMAGIASLLKALGTGKDGVFMGAVKIR